MRATRVIWLALLGTLAMAPPAQAGWLDIIWEMSGPRMAGTRLVGWELGLSGTRDSRWLVGFVQVPRPQLGDPPARDHRFWLNTELYLYHSTPKNDEGDRQAFDSSLGPVWMFGIDPMLAFGKRFDRGTRVHTAIGLSVNRFVGDRFHPLNNHAIKLRPFGFDHRFGGGLTLGLAYNVRLYPRGFDARENPPSLTKGNTSEAVHGFMIEFHF